MKVKKESEKAGLKHKIQKTKIMASGAMANRWENKGNSNRLYFLGLQNHCRWWLQPLKKIKRCLLFGRKAMANLDSILKSRDFFVDKGQCNQSYGFSSGYIWMWELDSKESWAPKNWCFWTVVLRRLLRIPWTARRSSQSILNEINPEYSWKDCWSWSSNTLANWCKKLTHLKRP